MSPLSKFSRLALAFVHNQYSEALRTKPSCSLLTNGLSAGQRFVAYKRLLLSGREFSLLLFGVDELVPNGAAGIKPLHENWIAGFWLCQCDHGIASGLPTLR